jgi:hypothetical protein
MFTRDDKGQYNGILTGFDDDLNVGVAQAKTAALKETAAYLATLTDEERVTFFSELRGTYCVSCGRAQTPGGRWCQCENDD